MHFDEIHVFRKEQEDKWLFAKRHYLVEIWGQDIDSYSIQTLLILPQFETVRTETKLKGSY